MLRISLALLLVAALAACETATNALGPLEDAELGTLSLETETGYLGDADAPGPSEVDNTNDPSIPFPASTNQENFDNNWAYVVLAEARVGQVDLDFVNPRRFWSCFEYRADLEDNNTVAGVNPNPNILDGRWPEVCLNNSSGVVLTIDAVEFVDVRMAYGAESTERFDWTRFYVMTEQTKDDCKDGGWVGLGFKNQGQCIASIVANDNSVH